MSEWADLGEWPSTNRLRFRACFWYVTLARLRVHGVFPAGVPRRRSLLPKLVCELLHYGPEKPIWTPPGARTIAVVTPSITRVGGNTSSAPSRNAFSKASRVSSTWTYGVLLGTSGGLVGRIPPPPWSE